MGEAKASGGVWPTIKPFVNGGTSGMLATCVIQPIDMIKVRIQLGLGSAASVTKNMLCDEGSGAFYKVRIQLGLGSAASVTKNMLCDEGFGAFYKGLSAGLLRQATYTTGLSLTSVAVLTFFLINQYSRKESWLWKKKRLSKKGVIDAIGNTPLIRINSLSDATRCEIFGKAEFLNPGGSVKDRVAVKIIEEAIESGKLAVGGIVTEGSAGSTAISLATVAPAYGCKCHVVIPDDAAIEKSQIIEALGATVERVPPVSITHKDHFVNIARRRAQEVDQLAKKFIPEEKISANGNEWVDGFYSKGGKQLSCNSTSYKGGFFADQFENLANFRSHFEGTGPEIWEQTDGQLDAFVAAAGTGGTVAGVSKFLKAKNPKIKCYLIDPPGSGLFNKVTRGVMYTKEEAEGKRLKNPFDTVTEGIGINRITQNFKMADLDGAFRGTDKEAVEMSRFLLKKDGLFLGSSSAMNCVGALRVAQSLGPGHTIVTILCDSGMRHLSKFHNPEYLAEHNLTPTARGLEFLGVS